jgi:hypothetical protein
MDNDTFNRLIKFILVLATVAMLASAFQSVWA